jgi:cytidylate kinase
MRRLIVTIDGPAGTGKSSVARELALALGLEFLDTGAMYRAATALGLDRRIPLDDERALGDAVRESDLHFDWSTDPPTLLAYGQPIAHRLRDQDVTRWVSPVSELAGVRRILVDLQRRIGEAHPRLVSEGRDQGSVVFHDADVKFYLDADPRVRAHRRADQLRAAGRPADAAEIEREIRERDDRDASRAVGPLRCPTGALRVDTSTLTQPQVVAALIDLVRAHVDPAVLSDAPAPGPVGGAPGSGTV